LIEFVPKNDSQVKRLLSSRKDIFDGFKKAFSDCYEILDEVAVHDTFRWIFLMKKKRRVDLFSLLFSSLLSNTCLKNIKKLCVYSYGY